MKSGERSPRILVVEDESDILFSLQTFLESEGYHVIPAQNGQEALQILQKIPMPQLILLDMKMPVLSGWEFVAEWRKTFPKRCPLIVMTAAADAEERAREVQADAWLGKPFSLEEIVATIQKYDALKC